MDIHRSPLERIVSFFYPRRCIFCNAILGSGEELCGQCEKSLPYVKDGVCRVCGKPPDSCSCAAHPARYARCVAPLYYEGLARAGVCNLKFNGKRGRAGQLALLAAKTVRKEYAGVRFDLATAVPMTRRETQSRGYNQSEVFCRALCRLLGIRYAALLRKPLDTKPQRSCGAEQRWRNVAGIFSAARGACLKGKTILLADDVTTTGATLSECAGVLKAAGAKEVYCVVMAATRKREAWPPKSAAQGDISAKNVGNPAAIGYNGDNKKTG